MHMVSKRVESEVWAVTREEDAETRHYCCFVAGNCAWNCFAVGSWATWCRC